MERLVAVVQELSQAHTMDAISAIVRDAARSLTGADGATFVLRDGDQCFYADENAIAPLWKGRRFPMGMCISGWVMHHAEPVVIEDIYADERIPAEAYRPTFVKSLAIVPIRRNQPIGAIGNYWATHRVPTEEELAILQALADTTSVALENAQLYTELEAQLRALQDSNYELSRFAWVASHDLQEPLRTIATQVELLDRRCGHLLDDKARDYIQTASQSAQRLQDLIQSLLVHARTEKTGAVQPTPVLQIIHDVAENLQVMIRETGTQIDCVSLPVVEADPALLTRVFQNLITNAIKFRSPHVPPHIRINARQEDSQWRFSVSDNGIGIAPDYTESIFGLFRRLNPQARYTGAGVGLATCKKIIELHGGRIWVESNGQGSTFYFTLPIRQTL